MSGIKPKNRGNSHQHGERFGGVYPISGRWQNCKFASLVTMLALTVLSSPPVVAQSSYRKELTLEKAVEAALNNHPKTKLSESKTKSAGLKLEQAHAGMKPLVQLTQTVTRSNNPVSVFGSLLEQGKFTASKFALDSLNDPKGLFNFRSMVSVQVPIFDQRQTRARVDQAEIGRRIAELNADGVRQQLRFEVIRTYYGAVLGKEMLRVNKEALRSADANRKKAKDMADVGFTTEADYLAAEVEMANAAQLKLESENELRITTAKLNLLIGEDAMAEFYISGDLQEKYFPPCDQEVLITAALQNRPDFLAAELSIQNDERQVKAVKDLRLPRIDAFANLGYSSPYIANGSTDHAIGASLTYTLLDPGRKARIEQAVEAKIAAQSEKEMLANQIRLEVIRSFQDQKTARAKIVVLIKSVAQAEEELRIVQDRYKSGLTTFNEVIRSEAALVRAKQDVLTARYDYYVSYASVLLATGGLKDVNPFN